MGLLSHRGDAPADARRTQRADLLPALGASDWLLVLGYSLHFMVISFVGWPGQASMLFGTGISDDPLGAYSLARGASFCLGFLVCFLLAVLPRRSFFASLAGTPAGLAFSLALTVGMALLALVDPASPAPVVAGGVLVGLGLAGNFALCQQAIVMQPSPTDAWCLILGTAGGTVLYFLFNWLPTPVLVAVLCLVVSPACGLIAVRAIHARQPGEGDAARRAGDPQHTVTRRSALRNGLLALAAPTLCITVIAAAMTVARHTFGASDGVDLLVGSPLNIGLLLGSAVTAAYYLRTGFRIDMDVYARLCVPAIGLATLGLPFLGGGYAAAYTLVIYVLFSVSSIDLILSCAQASRFYRIPDAALYALSFFVVYAARFAPTLVFALAARAGTPIASPGDDFAVAFAVLGLLFASYVFASWYGGLQRRSAVYSWATERETAGGEARRTRDAFERFAEVYGLTPREAEVAQLFVEGRTVPYIAAKLAVSESTVKFHSKNLYAKCGVSGRQELLDAFAGESRG